MDFIFFLGFSHLSWIFHDFLGFSQSLLGFSDLILDSRGGPADRRRSKKFKVIQNHQIVFVFRRNNFFLYLHHTHIPNQTKKQTEVQKGTRGIFLILRCLLIRGCFYFDFRSGSLNDAPMLPSLHRRREIRCGTKLFHSGFQIIQLIDMESLTYRNCVTIEARKRPSMHFKSLNFEATAPTTAATRDNIIVQLHAAA